MLILQSKEGLLKIFEWIFESYDTPKEKPKILKLDDPYADFEDDEEDEEEQPKKYELWDTYKDYKLYYTTVSNLIDMNFECRDLITIQSTR